MIPSLLSRTGLTRLFAPALTASLLLALHVPGPLHAATISMGPYASASNGVAPSAIAANAWATGASATIGPFGGSGSTNDVLGPADFTVRPPDNPGGTLSLGDGGSVILTFNILITNGPGADFVVFENSFALDGDFDSPNIFDPVDVNHPGSPLGLTSAGFDGLFLASFVELAFVAVSSDGINFAEFHSTALTDNTGRYFDGFGTSFLGIDPTDIDGLAGKHHNSTFDPLPESVGTPFDLANLAGHPLVTGGAVDLTRISHVRLIDVVGDGTTTDSSGRPIFDPTLEPDPTAGFDLDAVGAINFIPVPEPIAPLLLAAAATMALFRRSRHPPA